MDNTDTLAAIFLSDDLSFNVRRDPGTVSLSVCTAEDVSAMLQLLTSWVLDDGFGHAGVSRRRGNNTVTEEYEDITRMNDVYAYNVDDYRESGARFDRLQVRNDFDVTLTMLRQGYINRVSYTYAWGQGQSGADGGCSTYRTFDIQKAAAHQLARIHAGLVRVCVKQSKWGDVGDHRVDVNIAWKKAYRPRQRAAKGITGLL